MTSLTFYGGVGEIGGTKILFEHKNTRIFLDFGMSFNQAGEYFSEFLQPRKCSALADFFEFGLLPDVKGIYREDYLSHMGRNQEERRIDGVFLSHAHADHSQYIHFLRTDIPIYCTKETKIILQALEDTGSSPLSDFITSCEAFCFYTNKNGGLSRVDRRRSEYVAERPFKIMAPGNRVKIGSIEIEMLPVDHSMPGACGFIVYTDIGNLVYTGDIRFHGYRQGLSKKFIEESRVSTPRWLLCEGTRIEKEEIDSEEEVKEELTNHISRAKSFVFIEHPIRDLFRVKSIFDAAKANKREFVVNLKLAYLIREMGDLSPLKLNDVKILVPKKRWGLISKEGFERSQVEKDYEKWERDFLGKVNSITYKELQNNPRKYVVSMSFWEINQLTDIRPSDAIWIKSTCEPFDPEMEMDEERKQHWLDHFNIRKISAHASGHASGGEIINLIKTISPEKVYPIHTEKPGLYKKLLKGTGIEVVEPKLGVTYQL
jgi:ribonuclease J